MLTLCIIYFDHTTVYRTLLEKHQEVYSRIYSLIAKEIVDKWNGYLFKLKVKSTATIAITRGEIKKEYKDKEYIKVI